MSLPDEDPESQRSLMEHVLQIMLEIENLTPSQKVHIHNDLETLRSNDRSQPAQSRYAYRFPSIAATCSQQHSSHDYKLLIGLRDILRHSIAHQDTLQAPIKR